jgi:hypothetical protein
MDLKKAKKEIITKCYYSSLDYEIINLENGSVI